ncbi:hypothetical protein LZ334_02185 [Serratia ureilytica]|uniref:hypothetical protein n=1 Tax=Serratia ureilytica TaxID=300181 RepID=UPI0025762F24|nr:hypothetical protein [Serratia ureilytica]MDM1814902.1 hypothetical protein [Serratia ureilytica]
MALTTEKLNSSDEQICDGDSAETIEENPKSWAAWKREAERLQAIIDQAANREAQPVAWQETLSRAAKAFEALLETAGNFDKEVWADMPAQLRALTAPPAPELTDEAIDRIVVPLSPDGLDEEKHHCEWHLYHDRERIRKELREYFAAPPEGGNNSSST